MDEKENFKMVGPLGTQWVDSALSAGTEPRADYQQKTCSSCVAGVFIALSRVCEYCDEWWKCVYNHCKS